MASFDCSLHKTRFLFWIKANEIILIIFIRIYFELSTFPFYSLNFGIVIIYLLLINLIYVNYIIIFFILIIVISNLYIFF